MKKDMDRIRHDIAEIADDVDEIKAELMGSEAAWSDDFEINEVSGSDTDDEPASKRKRKKDDL